MKHFNPNSKISYQDGIYGLPFNEKESKIVFIPVPWDVTTSYLPGTHKGPVSILKASEQIDFFDLNYKDIYSHGLFMQPMSKKILSLNKKLRTLAEKVIDADEETVAKSKTLKNYIAEVEKGSQFVNQYVYQESKRLLDLGKIPVVVGGDHSTPFGAIKAYAEKFSDFGILHIDAHSDTRNAYIGFKYSHASIMYNSMEEIHQIQKLVQVGIRDFCSEEYQFTKNHPKISVHYDEHIQKQKLHGTSFKKIAEEIIKECPQNIYLSFDIDGLDPKYCPSTGTPVPGGLDYYELLFLVQEIMEQKKTLVGFDLVEVAPGKTDWDANVAMRLLYKLSGISLASQGICKLNR